MINSYFSHISKNKEYNSISIISQNNINNSNKLSNLNNYIVTNHNINGVLAALKLANIYIEDNKLFQALNILKVSKNYVSDLNILNLILLKISQIQFEQNNIKEAINTIKKISGNSWNNIKYNFEGDMLLKLGQTKEAIKYWEKSLLNSKINELNKIIKLKINEYHN